MRANPTAEFSSVAAQPFSNMRSATSRYKTSVSIWAKPSFLARLRASALLPLAALPSMAMTGRDVMASPYRVCHLQEGAVVFFVFVQQPLDRSVVRLPVSDKPTSGSWTKDPDLSFSMKKSSVSEKRKQVRLLHP